MTTLEELGAPLIYKVANAEAAGFPPPSDRHGQSVRTWVRSLDGIQKEALVTSAMTGLSWHFASDEGAHLNGRDVAPNPLSFLSVGMAAAFMNEILALAGERGIAFSDLTLVLENFYYRSGSFPRGTEVSGALSPELTICCETGSSDDQVTTLLTDALAAAPITGLMRGSNPSLFTLTHNGRVLTPAHVGVLNAAPFADPGDNFPALTPAPDAEALQPLVEKTGSEEAMRERISHNPPKAPVLDGDKKLLHLRTTCRVLPNGIKELMREQYATVSSTWRFLSEEAPSHGGKGRAPDAASYIAAGIAFCYMTQLGRYAHMGKLPLEAYRIIQDTHFSTGGATGGHGTAGRCDPVETHIYLDTGADDDTAQAIVRVAERTCFLHALCRDDVKAKVRFRRGRKALAS